MKTVLLSSLVGVILLTSCSTAYKAGQTPDDVYFSPGKAVGSEEYSNNRNREEYQEYMGSQDDAYLRRKVANRNRWSSIDDFSYWNDCRYSFAPLTFSHFNSFYNCFTCPTFNSWGHPFFPMNGGWGFGGGFGGWNGIGGWNMFGGFGWNNPFFTLVNYSTPKFSGGSPSLSALSAARNRTFNNSNGSSYLNKLNGTTGSSNRSFGSLMRSVLSPAGGGYEAGSYSRPSRSFSNSGVGSTSAPSSSAGGFSGGFGSVGSSASGGRGGRGN